MIRKLLLSDSGFPDKFNSSNISLPVGISKQTYIENKIIEKINSYNSKLNMSAIEYINIQSQFPSLDFLEKYFGVIVEDLEIDESQKEAYDNKESYILKNGNKLFVRKIITYVLMSLPREGSRNAFVAQSFFPESIDFMEYCENSPSFSIANHPIYYINYVDKKITAPMIIKDIAGMIAMDIENVEVFFEIDELINVPRDIKEFLLKYYTDFSLGTIPYSTDYIEIDINNKTTKIKTNKLVIGSYLEVNNNSGKYKFKGSEEKFYWMRIMPLIILSVKSSYTIDYSELENFYSSNSAHFNSSDEKFQRFLVLINFIKKIEKGCK